MIMIFTGNGKGKTTAALGQALRAVGDGRRVLMIQFIKGPWKSGEDESYKRLEPDLRIVKKGLGFVGILGDTLPREEHIRAAKEGLQLALEEARSGKWHILILDEVHNAIQLRLLELNEVLDGVAEIQQYTEHVICTGRDARPEFLDRADLVTEMREVKHPYQEGVKAKKGVEF